VSLERSDAICSALQLINFWQDLSVDLPRRRYYLPDADCARHGVTRQQLDGLHDTPALRALVSEEVQWARALMLQGSPLVHTVPGRAGWELRVVVQGGLRILDRIEALDCATIAKRPTVGKRDAPLLLWRALRM
jgi:phytoene/squalene synthetase